MWKAAMSDKFKVFALPASYLKRLFVNCTYFESGFSRNSFELYIDLCFKDKALAAHVQ